MSMKYLTTPFLALAFAATAAQAQDAAQPAPDTATPPASPGAEAAAPAAAGKQVSDGEVDSFAKATVELQKINADTALDETTKQGKMAEAVKAAGLDPARYNEIGQAASTDTELRAKVQTAMAKYAGPSQG
jgi:uncharacterized membrane protein